MTKQPHLFALLILCLAVTCSCQSTSAGTGKAVKPRYHHSWYKNHVYKKKWRVGRIKVEPQKQGVRNVKMKT